MLSVVARRQRPCCHAGAELERSCGRLAPVGQKASVDAHQTVLLLALHCGRPFLLDLLMPSRATSCAALC
jgi:hypothetical protein